ncbi:hypothetical protein [Paenibacillus dendritiformis]|uniref:Gliding motility protein n=1 Tax=Paenibacillus dendritiformis C454 TaxID=1131935 RepID=H3SFY8_9BACL|nr:hypothetical protein [Paenibacillus dendritiformis]EHQ62040.1 hypothetical protein PDENDC454_12215 [Paenibacillus dendritiformis C454]CAH8767763.1 hypothetical protein H7S4_000433 [Paenibacillus dendritiformis]
MKPKTGDIYCVWVEPLRKYAACQVTMLKETDSGKGRSLAAVLELDWIGDDLPNEEELESMKPLYCDYFFWNHRIDHSYLDAIVPQNYILAGNVPPKVTEKTNSYSGGWNVGGSVYRQLKWMEIPEERRKRFKEAAQDDTMIEVGGQQVRRSMNVADDELLRSLSDVSELDKLPCLTRIIASRPDKALLSYIAGNPFIAELQLEHPGGASLDVRGSRLSRLIMQADGLEALFLNEGLRHLSLGGVPSPNLTIHAEDGGQWLTAAFTETAPLGCGLDHLGALYLNGIRDLDLEPIVRSYPFLRDLRLWGKPGHIRNLGSIAQLSQLRMFSTNEVFGFTGEEFPDPDRMPALSSLWMASLPADAAASIKKRYKKETASGLNLSITKPRKPEWLAENVDNPFRDWDGRDRIAPAHAKKAMNQYKKTLAAIAAAEARLGNGLTAAEAEVELEAAVAKYTAAFNAMDKHTGFIETVEREEIFAVLDELLQGAQSRLSAAGVEMDTAKLFSVFDQIRDF